jgi:hypothetical protein
MTRATLFRLIGCTLVAASTFGCVVGVAPLLARGDARERATGPGGDPVAFVEHVVRLVAANRYREAWEGLNPVDQRVVPLTAYVSCETLTPIPGRLVSLRVLSVTRSAVDLTPTARVSGVAVRLRLVIAGHALPQGVVIEHVFHAVASNGSWTWVLPPARFEQYRRGECPGVSPAPSGRVMLGSGSATMPKPNSAAVPR